MRLPVEAIAPVTADFSNDTWWIWLLKAVAIVVFLLTSVLIAIWFERKVVARMQVRPGPNGITANVSSEQNTAIIGAKM